MRKRRLNFLWLVTKVLLEWQTFKRVGWTDGKYYHNLSITIYHTITSHPRMKGMLHTLFHSFHTFCFLSLISQGAKAVAALFGWKALFLQALHGPEICVARHHHVLPRIEARRTSQAGDKGHEGEEGDEGDESTTPPMACSCICSHIWSYFQLYAQYANFMVVHTHQIHPYTLHRFTAQVAMSVWPLVNHIHKRVSFDRKDFGPPHMCFPRWKVPELVGKVENMLPECQSLGKSAQKLWWKAIRNLSWSLSTPQPLAKDWIHGKDRCPHVWKNLVSFCQKNRVGFRLHRLLR